jgi:hypothetical protein
LQIAIIHKMTVHWQDFVQACGSMMDQGIQNEPRPIWMTGPGVGVENYEDVSIVNVKLQTHNYLWWTCDYNNCASVNGL